MMMSQPDPQQAIGFLQRLRPGGPWVLTAIVPDGPTRTVTTKNENEARDFIVGQNENGKNVYYQINPCKDALTSKASKDDIAAVEFLHVDADPADDESPAVFKQRMLPLIEQDARQRFAMVDTGNGLQLLYRLEQPIEITGKDDPTVDDAEARNRALAQAFGAKPGTQNIDRLFRIPGTINYPNARKQRIGRTICQAKLIAHNDTRHALELFPKSNSAKASSKKPKQEAKQGKDRDETGSGYGMRYFMQRYAEGMSEEEANAKIAEHRGRAGQWYRRVDEREHARAWEEAVAVIEKRRAEEASSSEQDNKPPPPPCSLEEVHTIFRKWLGDDFDLDAVDATLAVAASERLTGDPLWLLIVGGPGGAKTETVSAVGGAGAHVTSTITSEGALLSATPARSRTKKATGGLLRKIGERGVLVIKDVTSILSRDRNVRASILAAIREIYDGRWERNVGTDGGQTLTWIGRIHIIGAVTTAWDAAYAVVAAMGDRFVLLRIDSTVGRVESGLQAIRNTGQEKQMREELATAAGGCVLHASTEDVQLTEEETERLVKMADIVTRARTAVERDYRGEVIDAHAMEMPTRFAKQLTQVVRGGVAIGMERGEAMRLAVRCARDSVPPLRLAILLDVAAHPDAQVNHVRQRLAKPWHTIKRELEALTMLEVLRCDEEEEQDDEGGKANRVWLYRVVDGLLDDECRRLLGATTLQEKMQEAAARGKLYVPDLQHVREPRLAYSRRKSD
jgi:hypothetical protein